MNYFAHALPFLDRDPYFIAGTAVPDWMAVADRSVRVRARLAEPIAREHVDPIMRAVAEGALRHLHDDGWFHATRGFVEVTGEVAARFRAALGSDDPMKCGFLGHIVTELLLDWALHEQYPGSLHDYYDRLSEIEPQRVEQAVNLMARGTTVRLAGFIELFRRERFLEDYADDRRLLWRLNMVLRRVRLSPLSDGLVDMLASVRQVVQSRMADLLPEACYAINE